jgi:hypothetical protein
MRRLGIYDASVRTTLDISDALLRELRELAHSSRRPFRAVLEETLQRGLGHGSQRAKGKRVRIEPHAAGIKPALRAMSMNQLYDQIEADAGSKSP